MERTLDVLLTKSRLTKDSKLLLQCLHLNELPDLSAYTWVYELNLGNNNISKIERSKFPPNLTVLELYQNKLTTISVNDIPEGVTDLSVSSNSITEFDGSLFTNLKKLILSSNDTITFKYPPNITGLDISNNSLRKIDDFPQNLVEIDCSNNFLSMLPKLNDKLTKIDMSHNEISIFPEFPDTTIMISASTNKICEVKKLPSGIEELDLKDNKINTIDCILPPSLTTLNLCDNLLTEMPDLPTNIEDVDISNNRISELKEIPESVRILDVSDNMLTEIPDELKKRPKLKFSCHKNLCDDNSDDDEFDYETFWSRGKSSTPINTTNTSYQQYSGTGYKLSDYSSSPQYTTTHYYQGRPYTSYNFNSSYIDRLRGEMSSVYANSKAKKSNPNYVSIRNKKNIIV
ncbi:leucine-rich repeats putative ribonuclease inhibitor-like protein [Fadolivirus algeromassiliense]|jgi:Leucine-rich repeat (LRR) protein|uniref:Leucine-rich repeats putative ribonuclease inhibitor-like protein n=1 Tax=Fadolivirus FV1/VV64 TaxID=3070911 RepID=A0A7D3UVQ3_9VIRU|nr:leucine-rich repeats putative ribonuclease inhibitor-like protein [Fadolivirus algeromassiliense]QKF94234.1 leucine-rich repeats putative ribonuclease inhibitor-like protein [Fadolivirus FV1/VV64]